MVLLLLFEEFTKAESVFLMTRCLKKGDYAVSCILEGLA